jgi:hypothetical protein
MYLTLSAQPRPIRSPLVKQRLEKHMQKLMKMRDDAEARRRKQLWDIAKAIDDIALQELECALSATQLSQVPQTVDDGAIEVEFKDQ